MKFIVDVSKQTVLQNYARFTVIAKNEKDAEKKIISEINGTCLSERLTYSEKEHHKFHPKNCQCGLDQEINEKKIGAYAEEIDEVNEGQLETTEFICTCGIGNTELMKLAGCSEEFIKKYYEKVFAH